MVIICNCHFAILFIQRGEFFYKIISLQRHIPSHARAVCALSVSYPYLMCMHKCNVPGWLKTAHASSVGTRVCSALGPKEVWGTCVSVMPLLDPFHAIPAFSLYPFCLLGGGVSSHPYMPQEVLELSLLFRISQVLAAVDSSHIRCTYVLWYYN